MKKLNLILVFIVSIACILFFIYKTKSSDKIKYITIIRDGKTLNFDINLDELIDNKYIGLIIESSEIYSPLKLYAQNVKIDKNKLYELVENNFIQDCLYRFKNGYNKFNNFYFTYKFRNEFDNKKIYSYSILENTSCGSDGYSEGLNDPSIFGITGATLNLKKTSDVNSHQMDFEEVFDVGSNHQRANYAIEKALIKSFKNIAPKGSCANPEQAFQNSEIRYQEDNLPPHPFIFTKNKEMIIGYQLPETGKPIPCDRLGYDTYLPIPFDTIKKFENESKFISKNLD